MHDEEWVCPQCERDKHERCRDRDCRCCAGQGGAMMPELIRRLLARLPGPFMPCPA